MAKFQKVAKKLLILALIVLVVAAVWAWKTFDTSASKVADDSTALKDAHFNDKALIERGEYVMRTGDCAACHTRGQGDFAGGYEIGTPFGVLVSSNITPDAETGIGNMTEREFYNAVRQGIGSHGLLYPAMPYTAYRKFSDDDMHALWAYMSTLKPVNNDIDENGGMNFPYNIRLAMAGWDMLFFDNNNFQQDAKQSDEWNRGKYLVDGGGHCAACHSPRNMLGAEKGAAYLHGGNLGDWYAPDITSNPITAVGKNTPAEIAQYLQTGSDGKGVATGPMAEAVEHSLQYLTDADAKAIAVYLKTVPASPKTKAAPVAMSDVQKSKQALNYEVNCSACHGLEGEGIKGMVPAFADNSAIMASDPTNLIHAMLKGARAAHTEKAQTAAGMPSFAWKMNDQQIADLLNYVRNSWGNSASKVTAADVAYMRDHLDARQKLATPAQ